MVDMDEDLDIADLLKDETTLELFKSQLDSGGLVASIIGESSILVGFSVDKLVELLELAKGQADSNLVILIRGSPKSDKPEPVTFN